MVILVGKGGVELGDELDVVHETKVINLHMASEVFYLSKEI